MKRIVNKEVIKEIILVDAQAAACKYAIPNCLTIKVLEIVLEKGSGYKSVEHIRLSYIF